MSIPRLLSGLSCLIALPALAAGNADSAVRDAGRQWVEQNNGVGLSVGIYDDGQRLFYNFGTTQVDGGRAPTKDTVYEIGSISKTMSGQLLARAIVEGRASPNDEAEKYLGAAYPNLANGSEKIRLIHLVNMTSQLLDNIPDVTQVRPVAGESMSATRMRVLGKYTQEQFLQQLHRVAPRLAPGSEPGQSNVAAMMLGVVLEKVYSEPFDAILTSEIEKPLRMGSGTQPNAKLLATGYTTDGQPLPPLEARMAWPSASLRYSTEDLLRYASWQLVERDASVKLAHQPTWTTSDRLNSIAYYWIVTDSPQGRRLYYSGGTYGFSSLIELYPEAKIALVLLSNKAAEGAQDTLRALSAKIVETMRPQPLTNPTPADVPPAGR